MITSNFCTQKVFFREKLAQFVYLASCTLQEAISQNDIENFIDHKLLSYF